MVPNCDPFLDEVNLFFLKHAGNLVKPLKKEFYLEIIILVWWNGMWSF